MNVNATQISFNDYSFSKPAANPAISQKSRRHIRAKSSVKISQAPTNLPNVSSAVSDSHDTLER